MPPHWPLSPAELEAAERAMLQPAAPESEEVRALFAVRRNES